jgi:hypothetical protein
MGSKLKLESYRLPLSVGDALMLVHEELHEAGKVREGNGVPCICHLANVVSMVASYGGKENAQLAAVFHDCAKDLGWSIEQVALITNDDVAKMVGKLTEDRSLPWPERKGKLVELAGGCCQPVAIVLICDEIDDVAATVRECPPRGYDPDGFAAYWRRFDVDWEMQREFHLLLLGALLVNRRLSDDAEYPELNTLEALTELGRGVSRFKMLGDVKVKRMIGSELRRALGVES